MQRDQADGLRRLLDRDRLRMVIINSAAAGRGKTAATINLAGAMAESGSKVLILDECPAGQGVPAALGLKARFDLEDVIRRERNLDEVIVHGPAGILVLPMTRGAKSLSQLPVREQQMLVERCGRLGLAVDTLLVDAAPGQASALVWPGTAMQEVVVLENGSAAAITAAYALIKKLSGENARREFHLLVSNITSENEARTIFGNMARVARRYLQVSLDFLGHVPFDEKLQLAARLRLPVVSAFPATSAATSFRRMAQEVCAWPQAQEGSSGFDDFMRRLIHSGGVHPALAKTSL